LDRVSRLTLTRAWSAGAVPKGHELMIDLDSSICETYGLAKQGGSRFTYNHVRGYSFEHLGSQNGTERPFIRLVRPNRSTLLTRFLLRTYSKRRFIYNLAARKRRVFLATGKSKQLM
jgi:hypothetical protein